jgi:PAS domain S-box-containing protein
MRMITPSRPEGVSYDIPDVAPEETALGLSTPLVELLPFGVYVCDAQGTIVRWNRAAARLWGRDPQPGGPATRFCGSVRLYRPSGAPVAHASSPMAVALATGIAFSDEELLLERPDGSKVEIALQVEVLRRADGAVAGAVGAFRERRHADQTAQRLAAIVENSDDAILTKDLDGVITSWNRGAERVLGYTAEEVVGRHVSMLFPPEQSEDVELILGRIRRGEKVDHYETRRRRKDGRIIDVSISVSPIRDDEGRIIGASKIGRDVTQQKRAEEERREADRRKDEFLAMLAHELRNPLSSISNAVQLFGRAGAEADLPWAKDVVHRQVRHLARLIDDLLDVSRISRGKIALRLEPVDLAPILADAVETVRPLLEERSHELSLSIASGGLRLVADAARLEQVLVNLLANAAKYTEAGGKIALSARREGGEVVVVVRDTGIGIAPELLPRIFELFVQGDRSAARSEGGLGIGLTLVQKLVQMHGGDVTAASEGPGAGSAFTVRLPALDQPGPRAPAPRAPLAGSVRRRARVLVVDDNADNARGLELFLQLLGDDVRVAFDGASAVEAARAHRPEIVLLDIGLPGMDGYEVVRRLRAEEFGKDALIIAVSGYGQPDDLRRSREAGFDHHLVKPIDFDALMTLFALQPG